MAYPIATTKYGTDVAANPAYSGTFIPELWSGKMIEKFYDATVVGAIANTNWEGEIKNHGDKVIIRTKPTIAINAYSADQLLVYERPSSNIVELLIDKGYYWNTILDDVMEVQSDIDQMSLWAEDASEQMKIKIDTECLAYFVTDVNAANQGANAGRISGNINLGAAGAPLELSKDGATTGETDILDAIIRLGQVLDEQNIPETGRWLILPAWASAMLKASDLRRADVMGDSTSVFRNGNLGMLDRFNVYSSNLLPQSSGEVGGEATYIMAGHSHGLTFASQLSKMETLRGESTFGQIMRGLQIYGRKVVDNTALTYLYARKSTL